MGAPVQGFEFVFSLFALLLGLSLAEVLSGFAKALRHRRVVHLGWLTPLLAIFVMLDLTFFWDWTWTARDDIQPRAGVLVIGLFVAGLYYLAASVIFPADVREHADFDAHYFQHRRQVLGAIVLCNLVGEGWDQIRVASQIPWAIWFQIGLYFALLAVGIVTSSKRVSITVLALLIGLYLYSAAYTFVQSPLGG
jgi:hypothetical protein